MFRNRYIEEADILDQMGIKNSLEGAKSSFGHLKNKTKNEANYANGKRTAKEANETKKIQKEKIQPKKLKDDERPEIKIDVSKFHFRKFTPYYNRKSAVFALKEQLLLSSKIDSIIEEYTKYSKNSSGAGATVTNAGVEPRSRYDVDKLNKRMHEIIQTKIKDQNAAIDDAAKVEPGTEMSQREQTIGLTQPATDTRAQAQMQGAQNHAEHLEYLKKLHGIITGEGEE